MDTINIGYVGAGGNTRSRHIPEFSKIKGVKHFGVSNRSFESSQSVANDFGIDEIFLDWRDLVNHPNIHAVCIGTWPDMHAEISIAALAAGKHVLCEARMARSLIEAESMSAAYKESKGLVFQIVPAPFSFQFDKTIKRFFKENTYGSLRYANVVNTNSSYSSAETPMSWRQDILKSGKNILTMGIFYETFSRWIDENPEWLIAHGDTYTQVRYSLLSRQLENVRIPDIVSILSGYKSGTRVDYHFGGLTHGSGKAEITLTFEEATFILNFNQDSFMIYTHEFPEGREYLVKKEDQAGWSVEKDFVNSIRMGTAVHLTSVEKGLEYMKFTDLVHQSCRHSGMRVNWF